MKSVNKNLAFQEMSKSEDTKQRGFSFLRSLFQRKEISEIELKKSLALHHTEQLLAENKERCLRMSRSPWT